MNTPSDRKELLNYVRQMRHHTLDLREFIGGLLIETDIRTVRMRILQLYDDVVVLEKITHDMIRQNLDEIVDLTTKEPAKNK